MKKQLFIQGEVNKILAHIPSRTTRFWVESGLVEWSGEHADRRGLHREYAIENLWQLGLVEELMALKPRRLPEASAISTASSCGRTNTTISSQRARYAFGLTGTMRLKTESLGTLQIAETCFGSNPRQRASSWL